MMDSEGNIPHRHIVTDMLFDYFFVAERADQTEIATLRRLVRKCLQGLS